MSYKVCFFNLNSHLKNIFLRNSTDSVLFLLIYSFLFFSFCRILQLTWRATDQALKSYHSAIISIQNPKLSTSGWGVLMETAIFSCYLYKWLVNHLHTFSKTTEQPSSYDHQFMRQGSNHLFLTHVHSLSNYFLMSCD